jgi:DNA-directed RNA polymerase subunit RPC12/RpoP
MMYPKRRFQMTIIKTKEEVINICSICYEDTNLLNQLITSCNHIFCISCTKEYMINTTKQNNLECPYCRQIIFHIKMSNQTEINLMRKYFCKLTQTINFMEPPIQENYPYPLPHDIYLIHNYLNEFFLIEENNNIIRYNILFVWISTIILMSYTIMYSCNIIYSAVIMYNEEYYNI